MWSRDRQSIRGSLNKNGVAEEKTRSACGAYKRFFEGYEERIVLSAGGKQRMERVYTGDYYCPVLTQKHLGLVKAGYLAAFLFSVILLTGAGTLRIAMNCSDLVGIFQAACVLFLGWMLVALAHYIPSGCKRTIYEYKMTSVAMCRASLGLAVSAGGAAFGGMIFTLFWGREELLLNLFCVVCYAIIAGVSFGVRYIEKKIIYKKKIERNRYE